MSRSARLTGITMILQGGGQTAAALAARFEVSRRTILRDIDALCQIGVPVVATHGPGGGYALAGDQRLPVSTFTPAEATAIFLALQGLGPDVDGPFGRERRDVVEKLRAVLPVGTVARAERDLTAVALSSPATGETPGAESFATLRRAIEDGLWVRATYASARRVATHALFPRRLVRSEGHWYCHAISLAAAEERRYRLDRFTEVVPIPPPAGSTDALGRATRERPSYDDPGHPEVVVRLTYRGRRLAERLGIDPPAFEQVAPDEWRLRFRCPPGELPYYASEIVTMGQHAHVVGPDHLRDLVIALAEAILSRYATLPETSPKR